MKTKIALAFYYIAVGFLVACAAVIVVKLIFWPPCTQIGNTCAIDPWSTAGLAGTVLAVSATVLAILGAIAVAAWWTSLNDRVNDQVKTLYEAQKAEVNSQVDLLLKEQQKKVVGQLADIRTKFIEVSKDTERMSSHTERMFQNSEAARKLIDGMLEVLERLGTEISTAQAISEISPLAERLAEREAASNGGSIPTLDEASDATNPTDI